MELGERPALRAKATAGEMRAYGELHHHPGELAEYEDTCLSAVGGRPGWYRCDRNPLYLLHRHTASGIVWVHDPNHECAR